MTQWMRYVWCLLAFPFSTFASTYQVTNSGDTAFGGTLRWAIRAATTNPGEDNIVFSLANPTIAPTGALPSLSDLFGSVTIDGTTQPGYSGTPLITLIGTAAGATDGLYINTPSNVVRGLVIKRFQASGIGIVSAYNTIQGNYLVSNTQQGVYMSGNARFNMLGGTNPADRNVISGNMNYGIYISGADAYGNSVIGNYVGTDPSGLICISNRWAGVLVASAGNRIGCAAAGGRNVIAGNGGGGIMLSSTNAHRNIVEGNYCGVRADGYSAMPNVSGIQLWGAWSNTIGGTGPGAGNVLSGNINMGVDLQSGCWGNTVVGNFIGTDAGGTLDVGNALHGINLEPGNVGNVIGGDEGGGGRNIISGNDFFGIRIQACTGNVIRGNFIGLSADGLDLGNKLSGICLWRSSLVMIGGTNTEEGNFIAGNENGVYLDICTNVTVRFNTIGLNSSDVAISNDYLGIRVDGGSGHALHDNVISGNGLHGVWLNGASACVLQRNKIGTDSTGTFGRGNKQYGVYIYNGSVNTLMGGNWEDEGNVISGNDVGGVYIADVATRNTILRGNRVGTDLAGRSAVPNEYVGINLADSPFTTIGSSSNIRERNVISGNAGSGIYITSSNSFGHQVIGNYIGLDASGTNGLPNIGNGIYISQSSSNQVGGLVTGAINRIAYNVGSGIQVESGVANLIVGNSIFRNGVLGIDLGLGTPTPNDSVDPDVGPNRYQNYPVLDSVSNNGVQIRVVWTLDSIRGDPFNLEFYGSTGPNKTTYGEGEVYLGRIGPMNMPAGDVLRGTNLLNTPQPPPNFITALAFHDTLLDTSEFSRRLLLDSDHDGMGDGFEAVYFGGYTNGQPNSDSDSDTFSNLEEFLADTNPTNGQSFLQVKDLTIAHPNFALVARCSRERNYQVQMCTNLHKALPEWTTYSTTLTYDGEDGRFTAQTKTNAAEYRLRATLP